MLFSTADQTSASAARQAADARRYRRAVGWAGFLLMRILRFFFNNE
jgi:hypothetical protein